MLLVFAGKMGGLFRWARHPDVGFLNAATGDHSGCLLDIQWNIQRAGNVVGGPKWQNTQNQPALGDKRKTAAHQSIAPSANSQVYYVLPPAPAASTQAIDFIN